MNYRFIFHSHFRKNNKMLKRPDVTGTRKRPNNATLKLKSPYFLARTNSLKEKSQNWKQNLKQ